METYPAPARALVAELTAAAAAEPSRAVAFQGAPGANSHIAVGEAFPQAIPLPCFSFEDALEAVSDHRADCCPKAASPSPASISCRSATA